ncbi:hypothetical protein HKW98_01160 [Stutzerimonas urumqiensis]|uniref:hypothetical protein n=1 Tax=Stutzerimonas urumqiensis TaxID=638269 RepID=UPI003BAC192D
MSVPVDPRSKADGFEHHDANVKVLLVIGFGLLATLAISMLAVGLLVGYYGSQADAPVTALERDRIVPPPPRLATAFRLGSEARIGEAEQRPDDYAWVDRDAGVARIPLERARVLLLERGWPTPAEDKAADDLRLRQAKQRSDP